MLIHNLTVSDRLWIMKTTPLCLGLLANNEWPTGSASPVLKAIIVAVYIHRVPKNIPNIFDCYLKKNYQILAIFWYEYSWDNWPSNDYSISHLTQHVFLHYLRKTETTKYYFVSNAVWLLNQHNAQEHILITFLTFRLNFIHLSTFQMPTVKLPKMSAHYANTGMETLSTFSDSIIDNVLFQKNPSFTSRVLNLQTFLNIIL